MSEPPPSSSSTKEAQERYRKILEATTDVVAMADARGRLFYLNKAGRTLFGWPETPQPHRVREMYPAWAWEVVRQDGVRTALKEGSWSGEAALLRPDGQELPVLQVLLAHTAPNGRVDFFSTICRDITERKQKELERIEWANRYDAAIRASGQVLFDWHSTSGDINYSGDVEAVLGYTPAELAGGLTRLRQLIHPEDLPGFDAEIEQVQFTRDPFHREFRLHRKEDGHTTVEAQGFFFLDRQGRIERMVGFMRDVTLQRAAERTIQMANEQLEKRVEERTAALELSARRQEAVARLGQRALAGLPLEQLMQEAVEIAHHGLEAEFASVLEYNAERGIFVTRAEMGWPIVGSDKYIPGGSASQSGYAMLVGTPVVVPNLASEKRFTPSQAVVDAGVESGMSACIQAGDRPLGVVSVFYTTPRDFAPDDTNFLQSVANVLTAAIERHRVEADLRRTRAEAEAANRAKSEFLSRMSHELRTPLNAILGFSQLLEMEEHDPRQAESIGHISRAGQNLLVLINEVLDIARIDAGRIQFQQETVDVPELLREIIMLTTSTATREQVLLQLEAVDGETPTVHTDRERFKQVLLNLMSNAVKYNRRGGKVVITTQRNGKRWRINVTDTGLGIAPDKIGRLFVPFERLGAKEGGTADGAGLGLALCKRLITALSGEIGVSSTLNVGSTFWVELPAADPEPKTSAGTTPAGREERVVLYIEDDIANYYLLERILQSRKQIKLISALQGSLGLELARTQNPDLILLDLNLPDMSGEQLLAKLKADAQTAPIPVIAVTGDAGSNRSEQLKKLGALEMLVKPYRVQELTMLVDRMLGIARS